MTVLDPDDLHWAVETGARWGATYPDPNVDLDEAANQFLRTFNQELNDRVSGHLRRALGLPAHVELTEQQGIGAGARPYLLALSELTAREVRWALWWRSQALVHGQGDPGAGYVTRRAEKTVLDYLVHYAPPSRGQLRVMMNEGPEHAAKPTFRERRRLQKASRQEAARKREELCRARPPAPAPQPYGVNHEGAERLAADWMRHLGLRDAVVTQYSGDGGIDVDSRHVIAQVKNLHPASSVPVAQIRDLFGTATRRGKHSVLFTSGGVSRGGLEFSASTGIALIRYDAERGALIGLNPKGHEAAISGFPKAFGFEEY